LQGGEADKLELRPGLSSVPKVMSRIALQFMLNQMVKMRKPKTEQWMKARVRINLSGTDGFLV
jgi:hypothetical protein